MSRGKSQLRSLLFQLTPRSVDVVESDEIPEELRDLVEEKRAEMIEALAEGDDTFCDLFLNEQPYTT